MKILYYFSLIGLIIAVIWLLIPICIGIKFLVEGLIDKIKEKRKG